jgi:hypothetical protein
VLIGNGLFDAADYPCRVYSMGSSVGLPKSIKVKLDTGFDN